MRMTNIESTEKKRSIRAIFLLFQVNQSLINHDITNQNNRK